VFVVSWIGANARDHRLARLPAGRAADREHLSVALIDNGGSRAMLKSRQTGRPYRGMEELS
jgi:hypothetical protein